MIKLNGSICIQESNILKFRSDDMKLFSAFCLISIIAIVVMYILALCNNYNFLSYELGMIVGALSAILGCSLKD